jgi:hypothetical protein
MAGETMVFGATMRRAEKWRVYRIRTANSTYELEVQAEGAERRCAVLTRIEPAGERFEDSAPQLDGQSLYSHSPLDWIGKRLAVGTACTSEIHSVDFIATTSQRSRPNATMMAGPAVSFQSQPAPSPKPKPTPPVEERRPDWAPFPLGFVEMTEAAASVLKSVAHRHDLVLALQDDPQLMRRFQLALASCGLMVETLNRRTG